jgi:hypothetical protein
MKPTKDEITFWYKKLKESGFNDIENPITGDLMGDNACPKPIYSRLTAESGYVTRLDRYMSLEPYYRHCRLFLHHYKEWECQEEYEVWKLHAEECLGRGKIVKKLGYPEYQVRRILEKLKSKARAFDPEEIQDPDEYRLKVLRSV